MGLANFAVEIRRISTTVYDNLRQNLCLTTYRTNKMLIEVKI